MASGARALLKELKNAHPEKLKAKPTTCMGYCDRAVACRLSLGDSEPTMIVEADVQKVLDAYGAHS
jgi:hypothetical protein